MKWLNRQFLFSLSMPDQEWIQNSKSRSSVSLLSLENFPTLTITPRKWNRDFAERKRETRNSYQIHRSKKINIVIGLNGMFWQCPSQFLQRYFALTTVWVHERTNERETINGSLVTLRIPLFLSAIFYPLIIEWSFHGRLLNKFNFDLIGKKS